MGNSCYLVVNGKISHPRYLCKIFINESSVEIVSSTEFSHSNRLIDTADIDGCHYIPQCPLSASSDLQTVQTTIDLTSYSGLLNFLAGNVREISVF